MQFTILAVFASMAAVIVAAPVAVPKAQEQAVPTEGVREYNRPESVEAKTVNGQVVPFTQGERK